MSWIVGRLGIQGVKGVLDRAGDFSLSKGRSPRSIAIYAPNACGKSGYADAVEYLFSEDGGVAHLGKGGADSEHGGKHAIPHVLAGERGIDPQVSVTLVHSESGESAQVIRPVTTGRVDDVPSELARILRTAPAHRVLRQHDLRRFVVDMSPGVKYAELTRWLGLTRLEEVLTHLVTTSNTLRSTDLDREIDERVQDVARHTNESVTEYNIEAVLRWCATEAGRHLGESLTIDSLEDINTTIQELKRCRHQLILSSDAAESYQAKLALTRAASGIDAKDGQLNACNAAMSAAVAAERMEKCARTAAKNSVFEEVWSRTREVLESQAIDECPVCLTPWPSTRVGSQKAAILQITEGLSDLARLAETRSELGRASEGFRRTMRDFAALLAEILAEAEKLPLKEIVAHAKTLLEDMRILSTSTRPPSQLQGELGSLSDRCIGLVTQELLPALRNLEIAGLPATATQIDATIEHCQALRDTLARLAELHREREEYGKIEHGFNVIAEVIRERTALLVNNIVAALQVDVQSIYQTIHPTDAVPNVHIRPDTNSRTLILRVDFHSRERTVPPAGYLSESQINTLGLALFLSSVGLFNRKFPFLFLDDIVSSYDADHRGRIVDVIAERLDGFQVFLTTHDWRFYTMLRSRLRDRDWLFERISGWDFEHGPKRETDALRPHQIDNLIRAGDANLAGNTVRQYIEEWLDAMCARYWVYTLHKRGPKEYDRTLFDFWGPFIRRLEKMKGGVFADHVEPQNSYQRLKACPLLNYYSHAQANPYEWPAIGDVRYVWEGFQEFQKLFCCASCDRVLKYDHDAHRLYCVCGNRIFGASAILD